MKKSEDKYPKTLYVEPISGIAGDMFLAALLELGADGGEFWKIIRSIPLKEKWKAKLSSTTKCGLKASKLDISVKEKKTDKNGHGEERTLEAIKGIINSATLLSEDVKKRACMIFERLAAAEAEVHGAEINTVHFHEVGATDAIIDICGTCIAIELLGIKKIISLPPPLGKGSVRTAHGIMPVPAPATAELMKGFPVNSSEIESELTTPTGAAILTAICDEWNIAPSGILVSSAYGAGNRDFENVPNVLRLSIYVSSRESFEDSEVGIIECNMDDFPGEHFTWLGPKILQTGAFDYALIPATMKKGRPGFILQVICPVDAIQKISHLLLVETSTFGVRFRTEKRKILDRENRIVLTRLGRVHAKFAKDEKGRYIKVKPEADSVAKTATSKKQPYYRVHKRISAELEKEI